MIIATILMLAAPQAAERTAAAGAGGAPHVKLTATGGYTDGDVRVVEVVSDRDSDNDGIMDVYDLRVTCAGAGSAVVAPRDAASGMASGKRVHKPMTVRSAPMAVDDWVSRVNGKVVAEWDAVPLAAAKGNPKVASYDLAVCKKV